MPHQRADHVATVETDISASPAQVWSALTDPEQIKKFMFGTDVQTDWQQGSSIEYHSIRKDARGAPAQLEAAWTIGEPLAQARLKAAGLRVIAKLGTLEPERLRQADELVDRIDVELLRRCLS